MKMHPWVARVLCPALIFLFFQILLHIAPSCSFAADASEPNRIKLNADKITFEEDTGVATAEGGVTVQNKDLRLLAPYIEYDSENNLLKALSTQDGPVTFVSGPHRLNGERLDYNLNTNRGVMTYPNGKADELYLKGERIEVMPVSDLQKKGKGKGASSDDMAGRWIGAVVTTCPYPIPDYRLEAKEIVVIPGKRVVVKKPRVYLGNNMIFSYPFDYIAPLDETERRKQSSLFPVIEYESEKGAGLGVSGPFVWDGGAASFNATVWTGGIWEGSARVEQEIFDGFTAYVGSKREYDKDRDVTRWRPGWGLNYDRNGWRMNAGWSQRELLTVEKIAGRDSRYVLWRQPEVNFMSPWFEDRAVGGRFRFFGTWGSYEETTQQTSRTIERKGLGIQTKGEFAALAPDNFQPFYNVLYWYYAYDTMGYDDQQILDTALGVKWHAGDFNMETAYLRRWRWGESPMGWDDYGPRQELYQAIDVRIPAKGPERWWNFGVRGAYSFDDDKLAEMIYKVGYELDCMRWDLVYRDAISGDDSWVGLKLTIKAYPESGLNVSGHELFDPLGAPDSLLPRNIRRD